MKIKTNTIFESCFECMLLMNDNDKGGNYCGGKPGMRKLKFDFDGEIPVPPSCPLRSHNYLIKLGSKVKRQNNEEHYKSIHKPMQKSKAYQREKRKEFVEKLYSYPLNGIIKTANWS